MTVSAWGIEHGDVSKAYVGNGKFISASKLGRRGLQEVREARGGGRGGVYRRRKTDEPYDRDVAYNLTATRAHFQRLTGKHLSQKPPGKLTPVPTLNPSYQNAHPVPWGSKKQGRSWMVTGKPQANNKATIAHEGLHAEKSSWRLAQIQSNPAKMAREEARADTLSGTHKKGHLLNPLVRSHTRQNRDTAASLPRLEAQGAKLKGKQGTWNEFRSAVNEGQQNAARNAKAFRETQDKIDDAAGGKYKVKQTYRRNKALRRARNTAVVGAAGGGVAYDKHKSKKH